MAKTDNTTTQDSTPKTPLTRLQSFGTLTTEQFFSVQPNLDGVKALELASCLFASASKMVNDLDEVVVEDAFAIQHIIDTGKALIDSVIGDVIRSRVEVSEVNHD